MKDMEKTSAYIKKCFDEMQYQIKWKRYFVKFFFHYGYWDFFSDCNIEINTFCNRRCTYCPNSIYDRGMKKNETLMDEKIFFKFIDELAEINFTGRISPQLYGEPLLDKRVTTFMRYAKEKLPKARLTLVSNGDALTIEKFQDLIDSGVDKFSITQHGESMSDNMKTLFTHLKDNPGMLKKIKYNVFDNKTPLYNRGGLIKPVILNKEPRCIDPGNPVAIDAKGNVVLCCNDYFSSVKFGNLHDQKFLDIWFGKKYTAFRKQVRKRKYTLPICKKCIGAEN